MSVFGACSLKPAVQLYSMMSSCVLGSLNPQHLSNDTSLISCFATCVPTDRLVNLNSWLFRYYSAAAERGHADASYCLGVMRYAMGDLRAAFHCYETAAEGGNMLAWRSLASMYALGEGVTRSEQMANHILTTLGDQIERQESGGGEAEDNEIKPGDPHNVS